MSESIDALSAEAERFFYRLMLCADDYGRFEARPQVVIAKAFPLKIGDVARGQIEAWLEELRSCGIVVLYEVGGVRYGAFVSWAKHNAIRNQKSKFPDPPVGSCQEWAQTEPEKPEKPRERRAKKAENAAEMPQKEPDATASNREQSQTSANNCKQSQANAPVTVIGDGYGYGDGYGKQEETGSLPPERSSALEETTRGARAESGTAGAGADPPSVLRPGEPDPLEEGMRRIREKRAEEGLDPDTGKPIAEDRTGRMAPLSELAESLAKGAGGA